MARPTIRLCIDARPRGPRGPLAGEVVLGQSVLVHLLDLAATVTEGPVTVHARADDHEHLHALLAESGHRQYRLSPGPPPEGSAILRTDRLYDHRRLPGALRRRRDPESAVVWRLDSAGAIEGADDEVKRRRSFQPLGRFWALGPARSLARSLSPTRIRPNHLTLASASLVLLASGLVAWPTAPLAARCAAALALALALVLDTADGHLARLQGTRSEFGRWLDANLDELGDMLLHAAIAWSAFCRGSQPAWLVLGIVYAAGKYLFVVGNQTWGQAKGPATGSEPNAVASGAWGRLRSVADGVGHADLRWHLWILLAAAGWLELELAAYAAYYPARALAGAFRKAGGHV